MHCIESTPQPIMTNANTNFIPELLAPAGNLEKLKVACLYGANAVYVGGERFGLRSGADNFSLNDLEIGVKFAQKHDCKVYVVLNAFLHNNDFNGLKQFLSFLEKIGVAACIVSDVGVMTKVQEYSSIPIHLSTQASCINVESAAIWKSLGASRIITGREMSIKDAAKIKEPVKLRS